MNYLSKLGNYVSNFMGNQSQTPKESYMEDLEIKNEELNEKSFNVRNVDYAFLQETPLDVQNMLFDANGLSRASPAELACMRMAKPSPHLFKTSSLTSMDIFYDPNKVDVTLIKDGALSRWYSKELAAAQNRGGRFVIPYQDRKLVYDMVETLVERGLAFRTHAGGTRSIMPEHGLTQNLELSDFIFSDKELGLKREDHEAFLRKLKEDSRDKGIVLEFDRKEFIKKQEGPYLDLFYNFGFGGSDMTDGIIDFGLNSIYGGGFQLLRNARKRAFGVRFK